MTMSTTSSGSWPSAAQRRRVSHVAANTPARMHSAYALIGIGPRCHTPWDGLGRYANSMNTQPIRRAGPRPTPGQTRPTLHRLSKCSDVEAIYESCRPARSRRADPSRARAPRTAGQTPCNARGSGAVSGPSVALVRIKDAATDSTPALEQVDRTGLARRLFQPCRTHLG